MQKKTSDFAPLHNCLSAAARGCAGRVVATIALAACAAPADRPAPVVLVTTHTVEDTGLLDVLVDGFTRGAHAAVRLRVVVVGSGEALGLGRRGDADVLLTHAPEDERRFVEEGHGLERRAIMRNEFVLYGPAADPAGVRGTADIAAAFRRVLEREARFVSRGDDSGTHRRERTIWRALDMEPSGAWYMEAGVGQADALRLASERGAYILADRGTYAVVRPAVSLVPLSEGDPRLENVYSVTRVARAAHPQGAAVVAAWLAGPEAAALIRGLGSDAEGRPLFEPLRGLVADSARRSEPREEAIEPPTNR
jgi:tungstate transport system substrate-binding protein